MKNIIFNENGWTWVGLINSSLKYLGLVFSCILLGCTSPSVTSPQANQALPQINQSPDRFQEYRLQEQFNNFGREIAMIRLHAGVLNIKHVALTSNVEAESLATSLRQEIQALEAKIEASRASDKNRDYKADLREISLSVDKKINEIREYNQAREEEAIKVARWRIDNAEFLKRTTDNAQIEIVKIATQSKYLFVLVSVSNTSSSVILRPVNIQHWGFDETSPNQGGTYAIGTKLTDSFGNSYRLKAVKPKFYLSSQGIRPGDFEIFTLRFAEIPLSNATEIRITMEAGSFGQNKEVTFNIPNTIFFGAVATHDLIPIF